MKYDPRLTLIALGALLWPLATARAEPDDDSLADVSEGAPAATKSRAEPADGKPASAEQLKTAREHFDRGVEYYSEGDYRAALVELTRAYALQPTYKMLYNLGQVAFELKDYAGAEHYYRAYLTEGDDEIPAERKEQVKQELSRLRERVASLRIYTSLPGTEVHVDDKLIARPADGPVRVSAGQRRVSAEKSGYAPVQRVVEVSGGEELDVRLDFGLPLTAASPTAVAQKSASGSPAPLILTISAAVLAAAGTGMGYWAYVDTTARNDQLNQYTTRAELDRLSSQAHSKALLADILFGTAATAAVVGLVLYLTQSPGTESASRPAARAARKPVRSAY